MAAGSGGEDDVGTGVKAGGPDEIFIVAGAGAAVDEDLVSFDAEIGGFACGEVGIGVGDADVFHGDAMSGEGGGVHGFFAVDVAHPAIVAGDAGDGVGGLAIGDFERRAL